MEKKYWLRINEENEGPYSMNELIKKNTKSDDYVWTEGLQNWKQLKDFSEFNTNQVLLSKRIRRKKYLKYYLLLLICGITLFLLSKVFLNSKISQFRYDYGDDWLIESAVKDFNILSLLNLLSTYLILLNLLLFISTKKIGILIITIVTTFAFGTIMFFSIKSINNSIYRLGEKDMTGVNKMRTNLTKSIQELNVSLNPQIANKSNEQITPNEQTHVSKKFVIVHIKTIDNSGTGSDEYGNFQSSVPVEKDNVTGVSEFVYFDETEKAKLEDLVITKYLNSISAQVYKGRVILKETFVFDSYIEASQKRNEFLIDK